MRNYASASPRNRDGGRSPDAGRVLGLAGRARPERLGVTGARLDLTRPQVLAFRRQAGALGERLPSGRRSLRRRRGVRGARPLAGTGADTSRRGVDPGPGRSGLPRRRRSPARGTRPAAAQRRRLLLAVRRRPRHADPGGRARCCRSSPGGRCRPLNAMRWPRKPGPCRCPASKASASSSAGTSEPAGQPAQSAVRSRSRRSGARRVAIMIWTASWTSLVSW